MEHIVRMLLVVEGRIQRFGIFRIRVEPAIIVFALDVADRPDMPLRRHFRFGLVSNGGELQQVRFDALRVRPA